jgi:hypothetical protein
MGVALSLNGDEERYFCISSGCCTAEYLNKDAMKVKTPIVIIVTYIYEC